MTSRTRPTPAPSRPRHSRLTPERELEIYESALELLREVGYEALTMEAVATRTRSSKATLYRQWHGKAQLIVSALRATESGPAAQIDTGSLRSDLRTLIGCSGPGTDDTHAALARALGTAAQQNPELFTALRAQLIEPGLGTPQSIVRRAVERGEVSADCPALPYVVHMLLGYALADPFLSDTPPDPEQALRYVDAVVLPALGVTPAP